MGSRQEMRDELARKLKVRFRTAPDQPNAAQLDRIIADIEAAKTRGEKITDSHWERAVTRHCPHEGHFVYEGLDFGDLNALLMRIQMDAQARAQTLRK